MKRLLTLLLSVLLIVSSLPAMTFTVLASDENIAIGKPAIDGGSGADGYVPEMINDGDIKNMWTSKGDKEFSGPWVGVDLEEQYVITEVVLHNAIGFPEPYRRGVDIEFSNTPDFSVKESVTAMGRGVGDESADGVPVVVKAPSNKPYRYVRAIKTQNTTHIVNELEIYGTLYDPTALKISKDVVGTELEGPVTLLTYLDLVEPENEAEEIFGVNSVMTRGEAVEAIVQVFGDKVDFAGSLPFADVSEGNPYYKAISTAYYMGFITGGADGKFRPDDYTTASEFLIMTLRAVGYQDIAAKVFKNSVSKMLNQAEKMGLTSKTGIQDYTKLITRGEMAKVFYNALLAPKINLTMVNGEWLAFEEDTNFLDQKHNMTLTQGIVEENRISTLNGTKKAGKNGAKISGKVFADAEGKLDDFLGKQVIVLTSNEQPQIILLAWLTDWNEEVVLPASELISTDADIESGCIIAIDSNGKRETYDLEEEPYIIINGVADRYYSTQDLKPQNGQLRLLDTGRDGVYDVVFVEEYTLHYLNSGFYDATTLTVIDSNNERQSFDLDKLTITDDSGNSVSPKKVIADTVIKLFESKDGSYNRMVLYSEPITEVMYSISDEEIVISNTSYKLSRAYQHVISTYKPMPDEKVSVFVDEAGEVIWIERDLDAIKDNWTIAFSQAYDMGMGLAASLRLRLFTIEGKWKELYVADKLTVDGIKMTKNDFVTLIQKDTNNRFTGELVRYKIDNDGYINALDTKLSTNEEQDGTIHLTIGTEMAAKSAHWTTNSGAFWNKHVMVGQGTKDTPVFVLPRNSSGKFAIGAAYDDLYNVLRLDNVIGSHTTNSRALLPYMEDEFGYPGCFVTYDGFSEGVNTSDFVTSDNAPYIIVEKNVTGVNSQGEMVQKISGHRISDGTVTENITINVPQNLNVINIGQLFQDETSCFDSGNMISRNDFSNLANKNSYISPVTDIGIGDVVRYQSTSSGVIAVDRIFDYEPEEPAIAGAQTGTRGTYYECGENTNVYQVGYRHQVGAFAKMDGTAFTMNTLADKQETYKIKSFKSFYEIDLEAKKPKLVKVKDLAKYEGADVQIYVYCWKGNPQIVIAYPH